MFRSRLMRAAAVAALSVATLAPSIRAQNVPLAAGDGEPTYDACRQLGFNVPQPPRPAPPPPPPAPVATLSADGRLNESPQIAVGPDGSTEVEGVVVTGSRIVRQDFEAISPVTTVGSEQLELTASQPYGRSRQPPKPLKPKAPNGYTLGGPERYPAAAINPFRRVAETPVSTFSIDVDTAAYSNVRRFLNQGRTPPRDAVRIEELVNYFDYNYPLPQAAAEPFRPFVAVTPSPWNEGKRIVHIGLQGYDIPRSERPPLNLVFLVDVSGSMQGEDRLALAQKSLNLLIDQLRPEDHVSMIVYAGAAGAVLEPTPGTQKLKMRCAVNALQAGGSTAGAEGIELAYSFAQRNFQRGAANRVILMTDGDFNVGISDPRALTNTIAAKRESGVYLSVYGFGGGNYNDTLMQALAQNGNGTAAYIDSLDESRKVFRDDFEHGLFPIADDVKIQVEFNPTQVSEYRLIGYETRLLNREDFNNDRIDAGEVGSGASVTALYEVTPAGSPGSVDPLRYQREARPRTGGDELAFLRVRYKLPGQRQSRLMERPVTYADSFAQLDAAPEPTRWAIAVASWGQKLRGDPWISAQMNWSDIQLMANGPWSATDPREGFRELVERTAQLNPPAQANR